MSLLEVRNLEVTFASRGGKLVALRDVSFSLEPGERLGIVGESGAGKSVAAFAILNLVSRPGYISGGEILFEGQDLTQLSPREMRSIRGNRISKWIAAFEEWLRGESDPSASSEEALTRMLQAFMAYSPVDPVAGNPNSLESRMFQGDFGLGSLGPFLGDFPDPSERIPTLWKLDLEFGHFGAGPYGGETYEIDLAFGWTPSRRPRWSRWSAMATAKIPTKSSANYRR